MLADVPDDARVLKEEIFGPVAPIATFETEDEALAMANDTEFGLVAYLFTRDLGRAFRVMEGLETGMIGLNQGMVSNAGAPFGGVKQSGYGREGGAEGIAGVPRDEVRRDEPRRRAVTALRARRRAARCSRGGLSPTPTRLRRPLSCARAARLAEAGRDPAACPRRGRRAALVRARRGAGSRSLGRRGGAAAGARSSSSTPAVLDAALRRCPR